MDGWIGSWKQDKLFFMPIQENKDKLFSRTWSHLIWQPNVSLSLPEVLIRQWIKHVRCQKISFLLTTKFGPVESFWQLKISCRQSCEVEWSSMASRLTPHRISTICNTNSITCQAPFSHRTVTAFKARTNSQEETTDSCMAPMTSYRDGFWSKTKHIENSAVWNGLTLYSQI